MADHPYQGGAVLRKYDTDKDRAFEHYGRKCGCCGIYDSPSIDHIDGEGKNTARS